jgi:hypothetical protein
MRSRPRLAVTALGLAAALVSGCAVNPDVDRRPGSPVTREEAGVLAELLHRNRLHGGADFVVTAPFSDEAVLTLTGEIDFRHATGRAQAVTSYGDGRADDTRTVVFSPELLWFGDLPGLADTLAAAGAPGRTYLRRALRTANGGDPPQLVDVLAAMLLNLSARSADDPEAFLGGDHTWQGQRSIDSRLAVLYRLPGGRTVAVDAADDLLTQFATPLPGGDVEVTITLSDHGARTVAVPGEEETADAAAHPVVAAALGV